MASRRRRKLDVGKLKNDVISRVDKMIAVMAADVLATALRNLMRNKSVVTAHLYGSGKLIKEGLGRYVVQFDAPYAAYVEFGTRPHRPPIDPLISWATAKTRVNPAQTGGEEFQRGIRDIAWSVARKIEREGTSPRPFAAPAAEEVVDRWRSRKKAPTTVNQLPSNVKKYLTSFFSNE